MRLVNLFKTALICIYCAVLSLPLALAVSTGDSAPYFLVKSGTGQMLASDMLKTKLAVVFYETKDTTEKNRPLKNELNAFYAAQPPKVQEQILRIAVIRCSAFFPNMWRKALCEHSQKEGITIYGDWDGSMGRDYKMADNESNFLIIDKTGIIQYVRSGVVQSKDFPVINKMLNRLK